MSIDKKIKIVYNIIEGEVKSKMNYIEKLYKDYGLEKYYDILYSKTKEEILNTQRGNLNYEKDNSRRKNGNEFRRSIR